MRDLSNVAIVLTAHPRQQKWWAPVLLSLEGYPGPLVLAYDDVDVNPIPKTILDRFAEVRPTGYATGTLGHACGELVCMRCGFKAAAELGAEYTLKLGFDEPVWRWRNIRELIDDLEDRRLDVIDCKTRVIIGRTPLLLRIMTMYDVATRRQGSAESYWQATTKTAGLHRFCQEDRVWWERKLGLIHLQGEYAANLGHGNSWSWSIGEIYRREE